MKIYTCDVVVVGGGPAGLAAAVSAKENGAKDVLVVERDSRLGGILEQCIHLGFGLKYFGTELSGPEYADRFIQRVKELGIRTLLNTMVLSVDGKKHTIHAVNPEDGSFEIQAGAIVLSMGCRERTRTALSIPGTRPAGIFTAGTAQRYINVQNYIVGKKVVILGSGDIGMIMARRLTLENTKVEAVVEIMPYLAGLSRNKVQCLDDFDIPLYLGHTITEIKGIGRVSAVTVAKVDENRQPIPETAWDIPCDTVLLSVGLIPENELSKACGIEINPITNGPAVDHRMQTSVDGIFACGNVLHVNDLVDNVSNESLIAGKYAAEYAASPYGRDEAGICVEAGTGIRYVVPNGIDARDPGLEQVGLSFRVISPQKNVVLKVLGDGKPVYEKKKKVVNPGEMERILLDREKIENHKNLVVTVEKA